jgi:hypothetical protein
MNAEKKKNWVRTFLLFCAVFTVLVTGLLLASAIRGKEHKNYSLTLSRFSSDFTEEKERKALYAEQVYKKERFIAYGVYARIPPGLYRGTFYMQSNSSQPAVLEVQVAAEKGKEVLFRERQEVGDFPSRRAVVFKNSEDREIEPRLRFISGAEDLNLEKVILERTKGLIPWMDIIFTALWGAVLATVLILSVRNTLRLSGKWKTFLALFFFLAGFFLILRQAWISEDAFITLRHVDNFISGYGPVFNPGERVEGFSHPLWFAVLSLFRWLGLSAKGSAVLPGLLFSLGALSPLFQYPLFGNAQRRCGTQSGRSRAYRCQRLYRLRNQRPGNGAFLFPSRPFGHVFDRRKMENKTASYGLDRYCPRSDPTRFRCVFIVFDSLLYL